MKYQIMIKSFADKETENLYMTGKRGLVNRSVNSHQAAILSGTFDSRFSAPSTNTFPL